MLLHVQHLLGIGHLKRAMTLAGALADAGLDVCVASGGFEVPGMAAPGVRIVQLPPLAASDMTFRNLVGADGMQIDDDWKRERCAALLAAYREADPDVLLIELFPFGRRQMRFELLPLLDTAIGSGATATPRRPLIVSSVRDVTGGGQRTASRQMETVALVDRYFDRVLVHSDPQVLPFERTFNRADQIADRVHYTGFVVERRTSHDHDTRAGTDEVIVSAGGGAVGRALLETALRARPLTVLADRTWRLLTGGNASVEDHAMLDALARNGGDSRVIVERARGDFTTLLRNCAVSVSQAGYNTTMEIVEAGARSVLVPFAGGSETEQTLRASIFASRGLCQVVDESSLAPEVLAAAVDRAATGPRPPRDAIDLGGAERTAALLAQWIAERRR